MPKKNAMKRIAQTLLLLALSAAAAFAQGQELPRIAVYVTGDVPDNEKKALGTRMLASLVNSGRYKGIERSSSFLDEIDKEQTKQRSGAIDDSQISELGKQFGVKFVCIADITPAFGSYQVSARIVDVETAEVAFIGESASPLKTIDDLTQVSNAVAKIMFGEQPEPAAATPAAAQPAPKPKIGFSAGGGALFSGDFGGGITWSGADGGQIKMPCLGGGAFLFFDAAYAEALVAYYAGGGKWKSPNYPQNLPDMSRSSINIGAFAKYPLAIGKIKAFPLAGIEYEASISGKLTGEGRSDYLFDGLYGRSKAGDLSALWVKLGGGADIDLNETAYLRAELLYGARTANAFERSEGPEDGAKARLGHGLTIRAGAGARF
ncbi:MAG: CsgG/HfaB family protein [Chitinispirillales bacterium]|jgi:hypothetical protein|nr:CsgG/HfaB family protein [Chitinispirillales bacterium]